MMIANLYRGQILEILDTNLFPSNVRYDIVPNQMCAHRRQSVAIQLNFECHCQDLPKQLTFYISIDNLNKQINMLHTSLGDCTATNSA
jgi:hypothetical protein